MIQSVTRLKWLAGLVLVLFCLGSCGSPKRYAYLQNVELAKLYEVEHKNPILVQPGDRLQISMQSAFPELLGPFNGEGFQTNVPGLTGAETARSVGNNQDAQAIKSFGYTVDSRGEINYPVIGYVKVSGLTLVEVAKQIEEKVKASKYVTDPRVEVIFSNFKVYLLGALNVSSTPQNLGSGNIVTMRPLNGVSGGVLSVSDRSELNILEALSFSGDMPINANVEKVNVIRRVDGKFVTYRLNMKSTDIFSSPAFYLQQNDIIYVEPRYRRSENEGIERILQLTGYAITSITSVVTVIALLSR